MSMRRPLVLEPERSALLTIIVEEVFRKALKRGMSFGANEQEARFIIASRIIRAIECGETDHDKLKNLALSIPLDPQRAAA